MNGSPGDAVLSGPAYRIVTPRLVVRCWDPVDAPLLKEAIDASLDHLRPWMVWARAEPTEIDAKISLLRTFRGSFDLGRDFTYGIFTRDEKRVIGGTGLHIRGGPDAREIGYWIAAGEIGQGYATEVASALTRVAFEVDRMCRVEIHCLPENVRSAAVPRRLGFIHEATLRERVPDGDLRRDVMIWTMFREHYPDTPAARAELDAFDAAGRQLIRRGSTERE